MYAVITNDSYGDELELNYFRKVGGSLMIDGRKYDTYWVLKENDLDSREPEHLVKVNFLVDNRDRFVFL